MRIIEVSYNNATVSVAVIKEQEGLVLFDTGFAVGLDQIKDALEKEGYSVNDISKVIITHHDADHVGNLAELKALNPDLKVVALDKEVPNIEQTKVRDRLTVIERNLEMDPQALNYVKTMLSTIKPTDVDIVVKDNDKLDIGEGITVIHTPGHLPGHTSYLLEENKCVIAGDALCVEDGKLKIVAPMFTDDRHEAFASLEKIISFNPNSILCYHGGLVEEDLMHKLNELLNER